MNKTFNLRGAMLTGKSDMIRDAAIKQRMEVIEVPMANSDGYAEFVIEANRSFRENKDFRRGQAAFNALEEVRPDLANRVRATELDPFHRDERLEAFYNWVRENW